MSLDSRKVAVVGAICLCVVSTIVAAGSTALAAAPPARGTYFVVAMGISDRYDTRAECFSFTAAGLCSLDGEICGTWRRLESEGRQSTIAFELFGLNQGRSVTLDGIARVDARGKKSSIGGAGRVKGLGPVSNFAFSGRQTTVNRCVSLLEDFAGDDQNVVPGSGETATESRDVQGFSRVSITGVGRLSIDHTGTETLTITAEDNILPQLRSDVVGDELILGPEAGTSISTTRPIVYRLTVDDLDGLTVSGVTTVEITGIDADRFDLNQSGVSNVSAAGSVDLQKIVLTGTSTYRARNLDSNRAVIDVSGLGGVVLRVSDRLSGSVSGFGRVEYLGDPAVDVDVSGFGELTRIGD